MSEELSSIIRSLPDILSKYMVDKPRDVIERGYRGLYIDLFVLRKVVGSVIFRNTERTELTYTALGDRLHVEVYSRKFKAPEKITGLKILKKYGLLPEGYLYNAVTTQAHLNNAVSVLYGDSVTAGEERQGAQIPSRVLYSWALSPQEYHCVAEERTHNALSEMGTMWEIQKEQKGFKQTLFKNIYMRRGHLLQLVSFYNVSLKEFIFGLGNLLHTHSYGAEDNVNPRNIENRILGIVLSSPFEVPVTPYTVIEELDAELGESEQSCESLLSDNSVQERLKEIIRRQASSFGFAKILDDEKIKEIVDAVNKIYNSSEILGQLVKELSEDATGFFQALVGAGEGEGRRKRKTGART